MGWHFYVGSRGRLGKLNHIRVETNLAMVYYLHSKTGLYSIRHKMRFNDALRHLSDREFYA
jgi:hypothetical protein